MASYVDILGTITKPLDAKAGQEEEIRTTPLFRWPVHTSALTVATPLTGRFEQYAVLGSVATRPDMTPEDRAIFLNTNAPW